MAIETATLTPTNTEFYLVSKPNKYAIKSVLQYLVLLLKKRAGTSNFFIKKAFSSSIIKSSNKI